MIQYQKKEEAMDKTKPSMRINKVIAWQESLGTAQNSTKQHKTAQIN
jgi:hypothetical protein